MTESLVVIRTFESLLHADEAQIELLNAGIYSLVVSDENASIQSFSADCQAVVLAVHKRDAEVAHAVLTPLADTG